MANLEEARRAFEEYINNVLQAPGLDPAGPGTIGTPIASSLRRGDTAAIYEILKQYNVFNAPEDIIAALRQTAGLSALQGEALFAEYTRLIERDSGLGLARRVQERYGTVLATGGNPNQNLMWVTEDDERVCANCEPRGGEEATFAEWVGRGLPGAATCLGGDLCRCELVPVD